MENIVGIFGNTSTLTQEAAHYFSSLATTGVEQFSLNTFTDVTIQQWDKLNSDKNIIFIFLPDLINEENELFLEYQNGDKMQNKNSGLPHKSLDQFRTKTETALQNFDEKNTRSGYSTVPYNQTIQAHFTTLFYILQQLSRECIQKNIKAKFVFLTVNPSIRHVSMFPTAPIRDEGIHAFVKSLAKELKPFNLSFYGVCTEPIFEFLEKEEIRNYRKNMKVYALKKSPIKLQELFSFIKEIAFNDLTLASGNILYVGEGLDPANF
jgi:hypothetical protein